MAIDESGDVVADTDELGTLLDLLARLWIAADTVQRVPGMDEPIFVGLSATESRWSRTGSIPMKTWVSRSTAAGTIGSPDAIGSSRSSSGILCLIGLS